MEAEGRERLAVASFTGPIQVHRSADMRYGEQIFEVSVPLNGLDLDSSELVARMASAFHTRHEELYTYCLPDQEVVLVNARVAVVGELPDLPQEPNLTVRPPAEPRTHRRIYLGKWHAVPVYEFDGLAAGQIVNGPAVVESATTTVLLRPGDCVRTTAFGWLDIDLGTPA